MPSCQQTGYGEIDQFFLPVVRSPEDGDELLYRPLLLAAADVGYHSARYKVDDDRRFAVMLEVEDGPRPVDWKRPSMP